MGVVEAPAIFEAGADAQAQWVLRAAWGAAWGAEGSRKAYLWAERAPETQAQAHSAVKGCAALPAVTWERGPKGRYCSPPSHPFRSFEAENRHIPWSAEPGAHLRKAEGNSGPRSPQPTPCSRRGRSH